MTILENETITDPSVILHREHFRGRTTFDFTGQRIKPGMGPVITDCIFDGDGRSPEGSGGRYAIHLLGMGFEDFQDCHARNADKLIVGGGARWRGGTWSEGHDGWFFEDNVIAEGVTVDRMGHYASDHVDVIQTMGARNALFRDIEVKTNAATPEAPGFNSFAFLETYVRPVQVVRVVGNRVLAGNRPVQNGIWLWYDPVAGKRLPFPERNYIAFNSFEQVNGRAYIGGSPARAPRQFKQHLWESQGERNLVIAPRGN